MKQQIEVGEITRVPNTKFTLGESNNHLFFFAYYNGTLRKFMVTPNDLQMMAIRAHKNKEDWPELKKKPWWKRALIKTFNL